MPLPAKDNSNPPTSQPKVLVADNEAQFLDELARLNREQDNMEIELLTLHLPETANKKALFNILCDRLDYDRPELLLLDINLPGAIGTDGMALIKQLREFTRPVADDLSMLPSRDKNIDTPLTYHPWLSLPVVLITQDPYADAQARTEAVGESVEAVIYGKKQEDFLLRHIAESLPSWRQLARERVWSQLERHLAGWLAKRALHHSETALRTLLFLHHHLSMANCFVRLEEPDRPGRLDISARVNGLWAADSDSLRPEDVPVLIEVLNSCVGVRYPCLPADKAGSALPMLAKRPMLGARLWYADAPIGLITVVGEVREATYRQSDLDHLLTVANSLAAVCGRANRQKLLQVQAHDYSKSLSDCRTAKDVAEVLCRTVHTVLQKRAVGKKCKTTVRLLEPGTYNLRRQVCLADVETCVPEKEITLDDNKKSNYAWVVREGKSHLNPKIDKSDPRYLEVCEWVNAELCVPLLYGGVALGAVNLEHESCGYYDSVDMRQLGMLANQAALAISRLREHQFANALLDWVTEAERITQPVDIWPKIYASLFEYSGFGCLLHCLPPADAGRPWTIRAVHVHEQLKGVSRDATAWNQEIATDWEQTFLFRWLSAGRHVVEFTRDAEHFKPVQNRNLLPYAEQADAIIPLLADGGHDLHGLLLLFWFHAPPWSEQDEAMFARLGRYGGELMAREQREGEALRERQELEDMAVYGEVLRQFKHLYRNAMGGFKNWIGDIQAEVDVLDRAGANTTRVTEGIEGLLAAIHALPQIERVAAYMHDPKLESTSSAAAWDIVCADLRQKAARIGATVLPAQEDCWVSADPVILQLILFMLLDNALDALATADEPRQVALELEQHGSRVVLAVQDNGPGVAPNILQTLFEKLYTTSKSGGLGSALYIARRRARAMDGDLTLATNAAGARFELKLHHATRGVA